MDVALARHLLGVRQHALDVAEVDEDRAVRPDPGVVLDQPADQVALAAGVLAVRRLLGDVATAST